MFKRSKSAYNARCIGIFSINLSHFNFFSWFWHIFLHFHLNRVFYVLLLWFLFVELTNTFYRSIYYDDHRFWVKNLISYSTPNDFIILEDQKSLYQDCFGNVQWRKSFFFLRIRNSSICIPFEKTISLMLVFLNCSSYLVTLSVFWFIGYSSAGTDDIKQKVSLFLMWIYAFDLIGRIIKLFFLIPICL